MMTKTYEYNIGVDISKRKLDVSFNNQIIINTDNNPKGFEQFEEY
ncbi:hypothetical protein [Methyloglobulus sp.]